MLCSYILLSPRRSSPVCTILHSSMSLSVPLSSQICFYNSQFHPLCKICYHVSFCISLSCQTPHHLCFLFHWYLFQSPPGDSLSHFTQLTPEFLVCGAHALTRFNITVLISNFKLLILADILFTPQHYSHALPSRSPLLYFSYYLHHDRTAPVLLALLLFYLVSCLHYNINLPSLHHTYPWTSHNA